MNEKARTPTMANPMNMQRRVLGSSVTLARSGEVNELDFDTLIHRLLLLRLLSETW